MSMYRYGIQKGNHKIILIILQLQGCVLKTLLCFVAMESLLQPVCGIHHTTQSTAREVLRGQETKDCGKVPRHAHPDGTTDTNPVGKLGSVRQRNIVRCYI